MVSKEKKEKGVEGSTESIIGGGAEPSNTVGTADGSPRKNNRPCSPQTTLLATPQAVQRPDTAASCSSTRGSKASSKQKDKSKKGATRAETEDKAKDDKEAPQPGLWEESSGDAAGGESGTRPDQRAVSAGARKLRDEVYRAMIELLPPKDDHLDALEKKGVIRETAHYGRFTSLDAKRATELIPELTERFGAKKLLSVPGFELDGTKISNSRWLRAAPRMSPASTSFCPASTTTANWPASKGSPTTLRKESWRWRRLVPLKGRRQPPLRLCPL